MSSIPFLPWLALMFPIAFSAGPNNLMCASSGANFGLRSTLPFVAGINSNIALYSVLAGLGLGALSSYPRVVWGIRMAGVLYIVYLAYTFLRTGSGVNQDRGSACPGFWSGVMVNALNPKCFAAITLMYAGFYKASCPLALQVFTLTLWIVLLSAAAHLSWTSLGAFILGNVHSARFLRMQNFFFALVLAGVAVWIYFS